MRYKKPLLGSLILLTVIAIPVLPSLAEAQEPGRFSVTLTSTDEALANRPAMLSAIHDGRVVGQMEILLNGSQQWVGFDGMPAVGLYDLRLEGEGVVTEAKRGIHLFEGKQTQLNFVVGPGEGVHIVEYATGGLAREEVAARLRSLESLVADLQEALAARKPDRPDL